MKNIEEFKIYVTVRTGQKMKCELKGTVNMNIKGGEMVNLTEVLYVPQAVKNLLSVSRLAPKRFMIGAIKDKTTIKRRHQYDFRFKKRK